MSTIGPLQSEKLSNLILKWYEAQKTNNSNNNEGPEIDVIDITWILKALGFKLEFMDFDLESICPEKPKDINIEIKCNVSGLVSKLNYKMENCVCPKKKDEQTFWKVQSMAPSSKTQVKQEVTSCSLLPEMSQNCSLVSKAILNNLLKYYKDCLEEKGEDQASSDSIKKIKIPELFVTNISQTETTTTTTTKVPPQEPVVVPEIKLNSEPVASSNPVESQVSIEPPKPVPIESQITIEGNDKSPSESFIESINADKINIATSSPNEKFNEQNSRDANVVQALNEARSKINQALLYMKLNVTQDISMASSTILMNTPKVTQKPEARKVATPGTLKRSVTSNDITQHKASAQKAKLATPSASTVSRRSSFGIKPTSTVTPVLNTSALKRSNSMRDTPRPKATPKATTVAPTKSKSNLSNSNLSSLSTSNSSIGSASSKSSTKIPFVKPLPGTKKKIVPKAPSLIDRFKLQNPVTPKK